MLPRQDANSALTRFSPRRFLRAGDRLRVTAQLLDVRTSEILWSERIDADASDIIGVQDTIVQRIVEGLRLELSPDEKDELARKTTADAAASEEYLRGRDCLATFIYHTIEREHLDSAIEHFRRAIEIDPNFALAYSALGSCYVNRVLKGLGSGRRSRKGEECFSKSSGARSETARSAHAHGVHLSHRWTKAESAQRS